MTLPTCADRFGLELRFAFRMIRKTPAASAVAVLSLALGIGANTAIFSLVNAVLLKMLPVRAPQQLYQVARTIEQRPAVGWNYPDYRAFRAHTPAFTGLAAYSSPQALGLQAADSPGDISEIAYASLVSGNYFDVLGITPAVGRLLNAEDERQLGASPSAVLGYDYWQRRFAGDPRVVGRTVRLNGYPFTIVGVARRGFRGLDITTSPNVFIPITMRTETAGVAPGVWNTRHYWWLQAVARLAPNATVARGEAQLTAVFHDQEESERRTSTRAGLDNRGQKMMLMPAARGWSGARNTMGTPLLVLMAVVAVVLLIACANVASLMLARGAARQREIAVRLAMGATRARLAIQLLTESVVLGLLGGVAGLGVAVAGVQVLLGFVPRSPGAQMELQVSPDLRVLAFTFAVSLVTGLLFGLAPALQCTKPELVPALKDDGTAGRQRSRVTLRKALVVAQVALSLLLLVGAGLFVRTLRNLRDIDLGFRRDRTVLVTIDPDRNGYKGQRLREFYERLRADVERAPGVQSISLASITPLTGMRWNGDFHPEGYVFRADEQKYVDFNSIAPRYFETVGIPIILGRDFRPEDSPAFTPDPPTQLTKRPADEASGPRVAIVSESLAKRYFAGRNPVGMHIALTEEYDASRAFEIVGVVRDARYFGLREAIEPMLYLPAWRSGPESKVLCIRTATGAAAITETVRRRVAAIDGAIPVLASRTMEQQIDADILVERLFAMLSTVFGGLALLLSAVGLYGVISYTVARRTREIGIRMALGAARSTVLWLVLRDAGALVLAGAAIGVPAALAATRLVKTFLYGVTVQDPSTSAAALAILAAVASVAALVPALRATRVEPTTALRCE